MSAVLFVLSKTRKLMFVLASSTLIGIADWGLRRVDEPASTPDGGREVPEIGPVSARTIRGPPPSIRSPQSAIRNRLGWFRCADA